jgi:hypothetical protein
MKQMRKTIVILIALISSTCFLPAQSKRQAQEFADQLARTAMRAYNPLTGHGAQAIVRGATYRKSTKRYTIPVKLKWNGQFTVFTDVTEFWITGTFYIGLNGRDPSFIEKAHSSTVDAVVLVNDVVDVSVDILISSFNEEFYNKTMTPKEASTDGMSITAFKTKHADTSMEVYSKPDSEVSAFTIPVGEDFKYLSTSLSGMYFIMYDKKVGYIKAL